MAKTVSRKKKGAKLAGITVICPNSEKKVIVAVDKCSFSSCSGECEMCGSHGSIKVRVICKCGQEHEIVLDSW